MLGKISEKILVYKVRTQKDPDAFGQLYDLYIEKIYRFIFFKISSREESEDLASEVFLKVWRYLIDVDNQAREVNSFSGLIYKIARNSLIDFYRERARKQECAIENADLLFGNSKEIYQIENEQVVLSIMKKIRMLKQEYQEVLLLKYIEELSIGEIADILGKTHLSVRVILHRALKKLKLMNETGVKSEVK